VKDIFATSLELLGAQAMVLGAPSNTLIELAFCF